VDCYNGDTPNEDPVYPRFRNARPWVLCSRSGRHERFARSSFCHHRAPKTEGSATDTARRANGAESAASRYILARPNGLDAEATGTERLGAGNATTVSTRSHAETIGHDAGI